MESFYPLDVYICQKCFLVQLDEFEPAKKIFSSDYAYFSSYSKNWLKHSENYAEMISKKLNLDKDSLVIEIGSNDGYLLQFFKKYSIPVLGIEPAKNTARVAIEKGIPTRMVFFNTPYAKEMAKKNKKAEQDIDVSQICPEQSSNHNCQKKQNPAHRRNFLLMSVKTVEFF